MLSLRYHAFSVVVGKLRVVNETMAVYKGHWFVNVFYGQVDEYLFHVAGFIVVDFVLFDRTKMEENKYNFTVRKWQWEVVCDRGMKLAMGEGEGEWGIVNGERWMEGRIKC